VTGPADGKDRGMRIAVVGAGPAGLSFASLWKHRHPQSDVRVFEQNPGDVTWGFGVVFSERALEFIRDDDAETYALIAPRMEAWRDITLVHRGERIAIDGVGFSAIGRLELLQILQQRSRVAGVSLEFERSVRQDEIAKLAPQFDVVVAADGVNSLVRRGFEGDFGTSVTQLDNKFAWYGTTKRFDSLTLTFVTTPEGTFTAHHYRYSPTMSTFIVECDRATWERVGFDGMDPATARAYCERAFEATLDGHPLVSNNTYWRTFPQVHSRRWSFRNMVLVGDALHTAHFSIGSGTRLAMEDVVALVKGLEAAPGDVRAGFAAYEALRRPILDKLLTAANASAAWHETFPVHMRLPPREFAMSYITRSGRVDLARLREMSPAFMRYVEGT
jgi:2-polyprenyl-6-methoxyphenol hydroxylase-like FAD-dependent oxidoreductase